MTAAVIILVCLILLALLLLVPVRIELRGNVNNSFICTARFTYLFGLVRWESARGQGRSTEVHNGQQEGEGFSRMERLYKACQTEGIWDRSWELIRKLRSEIHLDRLNIALNVSLGEDYYTGLVAGALIPVSLFLNKQFATDIRLIPAFEEDLMIEGHINADAWMVPLQVMAPCASFMFSAPFRRARKIYYKG